ncbi:MULTISPECIES: major tail protein [Bacillus amyloliquefaciens group]|uniref:major tail protein n=1 Tax=Bacillus amyloliquefaciens group TaxID=1938374 RepID=UPI0014281ECA|nr:MULTISPECIES: major tail protein [Bacillus amyloliquefaciens group]MDP1501246.1 phage tail protein [Bacillus velezensis]MDP1505105.1 phage tail protein [Bacillus velezensis]MDU0814627.1 phage tail protein [Bacillus siamensis]QIR33853.1 Phage major tail protein [Bacillus velezensis]
MPKYSSMVGLEGVQYSPLKEENGLWVASKIIDYPHVINAKMATDSSTEKQYADNKVADLAVSTGSTKLDLEMRDVPPEHLVNLFGIEETKDGLYLFKKNVTPPWIAITFFGVKANGKKRYVGLVQGRFTLPDDDWSTKKEKIDFQSSKLSAEFLEREQDDVYKIIADEDAPNFDLDKFYEKVYGNAYTSSKDEPKASKSTDLGA